MKEIHKCELPEIISSEIPEIKDELSRLSSKENSAGVLQIVVTFTRDLILKHRWAKVKWNMMLVGWLYDKGDRAVKDIIENLFVRSFTGMQHLCSQHNWQRIQRQIPTNLYSLYLNQNNPK